MADDPSGEAFVVEAATPGGGRRSRGPVALLLVAVVVIIGLSAWGLLSRQTPPPPVPSASAIAIASPGPASPTPAPTLPVPRSQALGLPSIDAASEDDAFAVLAVAGGWRQCPMWRGLGDGRTVRPAEAGAALRDVPAPSGMVEIEDAAGTPRKVWVGTSEDDAARGFGGSAIVHVDRDTWTSIPDGSGWQAVRLDPMTPEGLPLTAWQVRARAFPAPYCLADSIGGPPATVVEETGTNDPLARLYAETGWFVCRTWQRMEQGDAPDPAAVDAAANAAGVAEGPDWVTTNVPAGGGRASREVRVYIGADPATAATRHGSQLVVLGSGQPRRAWLATSLEGRPFAVAFDVVRTPAGRTAWLPSPSAAGVVGDCPGAAEGGSRAPVESPTSGNEVLTVELLHGAPLGSTLLGERLGWTSCRMVAVDPYPLDIPGTTIDRAAADAGRTFGPLGVDVVPGSDPVTVFLSDDVVDVARWTGDEVVALDGRPAAWLADDTGAREWHPVVTPAGRTAWVQTGAATWPDGGCAEPADATPAIAGVRSLTCWVDRAPCLEAVQRAVAIDPTAFTDATEVAAGVRGAICQPKDACPSGGPGDPVVVTAAPAGWASPDMVRVFVTGGLEPGVPPHEVPAAVITPAMLGLAARPSIALPTRARVDGLSTGSACRGGSLQGLLRGNPWDPRVAWIGDGAVQWPEGGTAVFLPDVRLIAPDGGVLAKEGDELRLVGTGAETDSGAFDACAVGVP